MMGAWARGLYEAFLLLLLRAVTTTGLLTILDTLGIKRTANDFVTNTSGRSFTRPPRTSTIECSWRLCPDTRDVCGDLDATTELHTSNLAKSRVWLLWRRRVDTRTRHGAGGFLSAGVLFFETLVMPALAD